MIIISLSSLALVISAIWAYQADFSYEPIIVFILSLVGLLSLFVFKPKDKSKIKLKTGDMEQKVEVNVNLAAQESKDEKNYSISKNDIPSTLNREGIIELMKPKVKTLFIDDDKNFKVVNVLKDAQWKNTKSVEDIKGLDIAIVKDANIYFVDINGVGKLLECEHEGLDLALMLKEKYPLKKVVIYSASKETNSFHKAWDVCDYKLEKNALPYQFQKLVEQYGIDIYNNSL